MPADDLPRCRTPCRVDPRDSGLTALFVTTQSHSDHRAAHGDRLHAAARDINPKRKRGHQTIASFTLRVGKGCLISGSAKYGVVRAGTKSEALRRSRVGIRDDPEERRIEVDGAVKPDPNAY
jgi:hypothetical protein